MYLKVFHRQNISEQTLDLVEGCMQRVPRTRYYVRVQLSSCTAEGEPIVPREQLSHYVAFDLAREDAERWQLGTIWQLSQVEP